jgi:hypothetical protein
MHPIRRCICVSFFLVYACGFVHGQSPSLFMSQADFKAREQLAEREPWAQQSLAALIKEADDFPLSYQKKFGLSDAAPPPEGGQWLHWYACPETGRPLEFRPPDQNICPDTGKNYSGYPYDHVVYQLRNDALAEAAVALGLAFQFTHRAEYAKQAANLLKAYARVYPTYALHDNYGKASPNGAKAYSQTLDESIWLIKIAWTYDLIRGAGVLTSQEKQEIETNVLRASAATVMKAHKEPTYNIQSWINGAIAAVGFTLNDQALINEAIDGPIGFRHQMHQFVIEGFWAEGAWGYQFYAMRPLTMLAQMATRKGIDLWKQEPNLAALFHSPLGVVLPDGKLPAFNDSGSPDLYEQAYLYEVAYAYTSDPALLSVIEHGPRSDREAFLFGIEHLPRTSPPRLVSTVFPEAGFATLRSTKNDLTVVMKFGPHGGAHGHFDKLNFVLFSQGKILAVDPGTHPYGLPIHHEWDSMTIAHNTISVDHQRQSAATGKLLNWRVGDDWAAVRADAGAAYATAHLQRTILLTSNYVLIVDHCESADGQPHTYDWAYHNVGTESLVSALKMEQYMPAGINGYQLLSNSMHGTTSNSVSVHFVSNNKNERSIAEEHDSNSTPATYRSSAESASKAAMQNVKAELNLLMLPAPGSEVVTGEAPSKSTPSPVPFLIVRRSGTTATFATLLSIPNEHQPGLAPGTIVTQTAPGHYQIEGRGFSDSFTDEGNFDFQHNSK